MSRITLVMAGNEEGGLEKHVVELANGLVGMQHQVSVIAHSKYQSRLHADIQFIAVDLSKGRRNPVVLWQLYHAIRDSKPNLIHVHANKAIEMVAFLLNWLKVPNVATLHNKKSKMNACLKFDRVIAVSQRVANQFSDQTKVRVVLNGVQPPTGLVDNKPWPASDIQALAVGRLVPAKGFDLLVQAWKDIPASLWIAGDGPNEQALQQQIDSAGLAERIKLLGFRSDIPDLIRQSDVFIISSRNEGGPYTLSEALLLQRPVLSTEVGMVAEVLSPEFICAAEDVTALHQLITTHLQHPEHMNQAFPAIYQFANDELTFAAMLRKTNAVYQELIPA